MGKNEAARRRGSLMHSMLMATMMMVAEMIGGMDFFRQHILKLCISGMEVQFNERIADK